VARSHSRICSVEMTGSAMAEVEQKIVEAKIFCRTKLENCLRSAGKFSRDTPKLLLILRGSFADDPMV
jgi:hypothetical protein